MQYKAEFRKPKMDINFFEKVVSRLLQKYHVSPRWDPIFTDGIRRRYFKFARKVKRQVQYKEAKDFNHIGVFSDSNGGSHLFLCQLHLRDRNFCFGEGFSPFDVAPLNYRAFMLRGMFGINSIQQKKLFDVENLFYNYNNFSLLDPNAIERYCKTTHLGGTHNKYIFNFRNPFRCLISMKNKQKKKWDIYNVSFLEKYFEYFKNRVELCQKLISDNAFKVAVVQFEGMCCDPAVAMSNCKKELGVEWGDSVSNAKDFFVEFARCGSKPIKKNGYYTSIYSGEKISGWGGNFNPYRKIDVSRILYPIDFYNELPNFIFTIARKYLSSALIDFYLDDLKHEYKNSSTDFVNLF